VVRLSRLSGRTLDPSTASAANVTGSISPAITAWRIARALLPTMSVMTESSLTSASSKVLLQPFGYMAAGLPSQLLTRSQQTAEAVPPLT
jgi:hypothetical protein